MPATLPTHDVLNQPPPLLGHNAFDADPALREALDPVTDVFCASRLGGGGWAFGTIPDGVTAEAVVTTALEV